MLIELQSHYLDLVVQAVEAAEGACLLRRRDSDTGMIYVTRGESTTTAEYVIAFTFDDAGVKLGVKFRDSRKPVVFESSYEDGIDEFFPLFSKALKSNRLEDLRVA
jgi:hypothetical protein